MATAMDIELLATDLWLGEKNAKINNVQIRMGTLTGQKPTAKLTTTNPHITLN